MKLNLHVFPLFLYEDTDGSAIQRKLLLLKNEVINVWPDWPLIKYSQQCPEDKGTFRDMTKISYFNMSDWFHAMTDWRLICIMP